VKFVILVEDYNLFYTDYLDEHKQLNDKSYQEKITLLLKKKYYQADSLAQALIKLGHQAEVIIPTCNPLQINWAKENNKWLFYKWHLQKPIRSLQARFLSQYNTFDTIRDEILLAQIKKEKPDVVFVYSSIWIGKRTLQKIKSIVRKTILQWSCPISMRWEKFFFNEFDFIVSASPSISAYFTKKGIKSFYLQQAFDTEIVAEINNDNHKSDIVFIGNFSKYHSYRFEIVEYLLQNGVSIDIYGTIDDNFHPGSLLKSKIKAPIIGAEMFDVYKQYKLALHVYGGGTENDGIDWSSYAGAKRIFEITGAGVALITSFQKNLKEMFDDDEILTFNTREECLQIINYYLSNTNELINIAKKGQQKTLSSHTFINRAEKLIYLIQEN
jgi:spore maturation protein CgeB